MKVRVMSDGVADDMARARPRVVEEGEESEDGDALPVAGSGWEDSAEGGKAGERAEERFSSA